MTDIIKALTTEMLDANFATTEIKSFLIMLDKNMMSDDQVEARVKSLYNKFNSVKNRTSSGADATMRSLITKIIIKQTIPTVEIDAVNCATQIAILIEEKQDWDPQTQPYVDWYVNSFLKK